ncbi:MAG TPA: peptidylprolyl isomerase [Gemmatimonadota bacterium]|nr:peptidylprolyl isomerase [Gemmatimonadota bacterium]
MATRPAIFPRALVLLALAAVAACGRGKDESETVARVGDKTITVEDVAGYMQRANYGANLKDVERAVNEMIDAHLVLDRARNRYTPVPVESLQMREWKSTLLVNQFRENVIWKDVKVDEAKLQEWYDQNVGEQVTLDHILIRGPQSAPTAAPGGGAAPGSPQEPGMQAAKREADSLLVALKGGADFAAAAREHSDDASSAAGGGRMQPFGRGQMVASFEQAAFETPVGQFAPVIESQFGFHILKVVERSKPALDDVREEIESQLARPMQGEAEDRYITNLMETSRLEFHETNIDSLIGILDAERPPQSGERDLELATFEGGRIPLGEIWGLYEVLPPGNRQAIAQLDQSGMVQALASMVQQKLMLARAEAAGVVLDSLRQAQLDERVDQLLLSAYMRDASQARMEVGDEEVRRYYEEHREFYADRSFEIVAPEIRQVLASQRHEEVSGPDAQRATLAAIADSQEDAVDVVRNTDTYDQVLRTLRREREEAGIPEPGPAPPPPAPAGAVAEDAVQETPSAP